MPTPRAFPAALLTAFLLCPLVAPAVEPSGAEDSPPTINLRRTVTVQVVQKTKDAVVNISTTKKMLVRNNWFQSVAVVPANSLGSGFIIHKDGYVITNNHVIDQARQITVELADGRKLPADLLNTDPDADLALLRIHSDAPLPILDMGTSNDLLIGEPVIAVGNPLGFSHSVSTGIVSAVHRDIDPGRPDQPVDQPLRGEQAALRDLIQTDAAINPGNSGGPLLNAYGQVIGINTAIRGDAQNIGFAIPIDRLRDWIPTLMNPSLVNKVDVPLKLEEKRKIIEPATVVSTIVSDGPESQELKSINGQRPVNIIDAYSMLLQLKAKTPFTVEWVSGKTEKLTPVPAPIPDTIVQAKQRLGMTVEQVTPMIAQKMNLAIDSGVLITGVERNGPADKISLQPGDILVRFGGAPVSTLNDFGSLLHRLPETGRIRVTVYRGTTPGYGILEF